MSDDTSNIVLEHLRALRVGQDALREDMRVMVWAIGINAAATITMLVKLWSTQ